MAIHVTCPSCRAGGQVPDEALGHQLSCPVCGHAFLLAKPQSPAEMPDFLGVWVDPAHALSPTVMPPAAVATTGVAPAPNVPKTADIPATEQVPPPVPDSPMPAEWVHTEKERFDAYLTEGLARLERVRRENADAESRHEAACVTRSVELSRQSTLLTIRGQDLDRREGEMRRTADALAAREQEVATRETELVERAAVVATKESHRAALESEAASLARLIAELRPAVESLELRKVEAETLRAEIAAKQTALDRRLISVGRSELAIQKRMAELDEMEQTLRLELEEREADLERQRASLVEEAHALRERASVGHPTPMPRAALPPALPSLTTRQSSD